jgi:gamma-glutamylcyclotransferase (GGCT)/AIG2-like uncharacterized protein YtfP
LRNIKRYAPSARPQRAAVLRGYRLVFRGFLDIAPDKNGAVLGALYEITPACVRALDIYEGEDYRKIDVTVETDEGPRQAMTYMMKGGDIAPPQLAYYNIIARGYADWKLDAEPLRRARFATVKR